MEIIIPERKKKKTPHNHSNTHHELGRESRPRQHSAQQICSFPTVRSARLRVSVHRLPLDELLLLFNPKLLLPQLLVLVLVLLPQHQQLVFHLGHSGGHEVRGTHVTGGVGRWHVRPLHLGVVTWPPRPPSLLPLLQDGLLEPLRILEVRHQEHLPNEENMFVLRKVCFSWLG